jgi:hypothetical protein
MEEFFYLHFFVSLALMAKLAREELFRVYNMLIKHNNFTFLITHSSLLAKYIETVVCTTFNPWKMQIYLRIQAPNYQEV